MPCSSPSGISSVRPSRKPTTSAGPDRARRRAAAVGADEAHLADLGLQAGGLDDQPDQVADEAVAPGEVGFADRLGGAARAATRPWLTGRRSLDALRRPELGARPRARARAACARSRRPRPRTVRTIALPRPTRSSDCRSHSSTPLPCAVSSPIAALTTSRSAGLTSTVIVRRSTIRRSAPCTTSTTSSGRACSAPARILPASAQRELDRVGFDRLHGLAAQRLDALRRPRRARRSRRRSRPRPARARRRAPARSPPRARSRGSVRRRPSPARAAARPRRAAAASEARAARRRS